MRAWRRPCFFSRCKTVCHCIKWQRHPTRRARQAHQARSGPAAPRPQRPKVQPTATFPTTVINRQRSSISKRSSPNRQQPYRLLPLPLKTKTADGIMNTFGQSCGIVRIFFNSPLFFNFVKFLEGAATAAATYGGVYSGAYGVAPSQPVYAYSGAPAATYEQVYLPTRQRK